jgi:hypothetical protein
MPELKNPQKGDIFLDNKKAVNPSSRIQSDLYAMSIANKYYDNKKSRRTLMYSGFW